MSTFKLAELDFVVPDAAEAGLAIHLPTSTSLGVRDLATGREVSIEIGSQRTFGGLSPNHHWLAAGNADGVARVWNIHTGLPLTPPLMHPDRVRHTFFTADGRRLIVQCEKLRAYVWDVSPDPRPRDALIALVQQMSGRYVGSGGLLLSDDGRRFAAGVREEYRPTPTVARRWREQQIADSLQEGHLRAVEFHRRWLITELATGVAGPDPSAGKP
jgi:hypothetical protein